MVRLLTLAGVAFAGALIATSSSAVAGDINAGRAVFTSQCGVCHTVTKGGPNLVGPNLYGVVGRPAGSIQGYAYSPAMRSAGFAWSNNKLEEYLNSPAGVVPGNRMPYAGLKQKPKLDDVISYLDTLK